MTSTSDKYDVLEEMYRLGASDPRRRVLLQEVRNHFGWPKERFASVVAELNNDDKWIDVQTIPHITGFAALTLEGRRQVESRIHPTSTITHNTISAQQIIGSAIQQGSLHATQLATSTFQVKSAREALEVFETAIQQAQLPSATLAQLVGDVETIRAQLKKPSPSQTIVREAGKSLRNIVEGISAALLTPSIIAAAPALWSALGLG